MITLLIVLQQIFISSHATELVLPCREHMREGKAMFPPCAELKADIKAALDLAIEGQGSNVDGKRGVIPNLYDGKYTNFGLVDSSRGDKKAREGFGTPVCNPLKDELNTNQKGQSCGLSFGAKMHWVENSRKGKKKWDKEGMKLSIIANGSQAHGNNPGQTPFGETQASYLRGALVAAYQCELSRVKAEVDLGKITVHPSLEESAKHLNKVITHSMQISRTIASDEEINRLNVEGVDFCNESTDLESVGISVAHRTAGCQLSSGMLYLKAAVKQFAISSVIMNADSNYSSLSDQKDEIYNQAIAEIRPACEARIYSECGNPDNWPNRPRAAKEKYRDFKKCVGTGPGPDHLLYRCVNEGYQNFFKEKMRSHFSGCQAGIEWVSFFLMLLGFMSLKPKNYFVPVRSKENRDRSFQRKKVLILLLTFGSLIAGGCNKGSSPGVGVAEIPDEYCLNPDGIPYITQSEAEKCCSGPSLDQSRTIDQVGEANEELCGFTDGGGGHTANNGVDAIANNAGRAGEAVRNAADHVGDNTLTEADDIPSNGYATDDIMHATGLAAVSYPGGDEDSSSGDEGVIDFGRPIPGKNSRAGGNPNGSNGGSSDFAGGSGGSAGGGFGSGQNGLGNSGNFFGNGAYGTDAQKRALAEAKAISDATTDEGSYGGGKGAFGKNKSSGFNPFGSGSSGGLAAVGTDLSPYNKEKGPEINPYGSGDPEDYFGLIDSEANIFKIVERRYQQKSMRWEEIKVQEQRKAFERKFASEIKK